MSIILIFVSYKLIEALINSGAFTDSSEEEKMKKLGFATGSEVRKKCIHGISYITNFNKSL